MLIEGYTFYPQGSFGGFADYVYSKRGNKLILISGYSFYRHRTSHQKKTRWLCSTHQRHGCRAVVYTIYDEIISCNLQHNHEPKVNWVTEKPENCVHDCMHINRS
ncbi:hypothetical protein PYW07_016454 [Mythimna separata]|uniref:FLYWCH-type domain-containing protein n=1 Tax=Mythimna separata TaxID=271217 RepID=A0AAD7YLA2_MYTSE|nr:hypothetical protein PYW07_016454 [Mythimna separata]